MSAPMRVRFTKGPPGAAGHALTCVRADGSETTLALEKSPMLPALMIQFVVEHTLQWSDGQFGSVARGAPLGEERSSTKPTASLQTRQSRALAICLGDEQWRGASDAEAFFERLERECRRHRVSRPELSAENLAALRQALRATGAAWRPLAPGSSLEREFPA